MFSLNEHLQELTIDNRNESLEVRTSTLETLRLWLKKSPHLKARTDEMFLLAFLRYSQFHLEDCKKRLESFYTMKTVFPEILQNRLLNQSKMDMYRKGIHIILPKPITQSGPRIVISHFSKCNSKEANERNAFFKLFFMLLEILVIEDPNTAICGIFYVIDGRDVTVEQNLEFDPFVLKKTWSLVEYALPIKFREIHLINMRKDERRVFKYVSSFVPSQMPIKFIVHKKAEDLYEHVPREAMPVEYGGNYGYQTEALHHWEPIILKYRKYFEDDQQYGIQNKNFKQKMQSSSVEIQQLTGLSGSFRRLPSD